MLANWLGVTRSCIIKPTVVTTHLPTRENMQNQMAGYAGNGRVLRKHVLARGLDRSSAFIGRIAAM